MSILSWFKRKPAVTSPALTLPSVEPPAFATPAFATPAFTTPESATEALPGALASPLRDEIPADPDDQSQGQASLDLLHQAFGDADLPPSPLISLLDGLEDVDPGLLSQEASDLLLQLRRN